MNYKEKYEQAMLRMNKWVEGSEIIEPKEVAEFVFPELKESEDERISKEIICGIQDAWDNEGFSIDTKRAKIDEWIAWLEKQGEQTNKVSIWKHWNNGIAGNGEGKPVYLIKNGSTYSLSSCLGFECDYIELSELDSLMLEKQGEQKTADKVESKFKSGDWINRDGAIWRIEGVNGKEYILGGRPDVVIQEPIHIIDSEFHLWTIKDAKDGDVLSFDNEYSSYHSIGIFKRIACKNEPNGNSYRCYVRYDGFKEELKIAIYGGELHHCGTSAHPATKEQRDLLFSKMKEAGYEWDVEKKELKKIEQKPNFCHHEVDFSDCSEEYRKAYYDGWNNCNQQHAQLEAEQKPSWSEEDETVLNNLIYALANDRIGNCRYEYVNWLKSLKERMKGE